MSLEVRELGHITFYEAVPPNPANNTTYFLLHGIGTSLDFWVAVAPLLGKENRTIAIDIPGFGRSSLPKDGPILEAAVRQISEFTRSLDVNNGILVAHSLGAFVALRLAAVERSRFQRLILVDGTLGRALQLIKNPRSILCQPALGAIVSTQFLAGTLPLKKNLTSIIGHSSLLRSLTLRPWVDEPGHLDPGIVTAALSNNGGLGSLRSLAAARQIEYEDLLRGVTQPVDLVWGERDNLINASDIEYVASLVNVDRRMAIPRCGHWPMIEYPIVLAQFISAWNEDGKVEDRNN
ncbi:MAG TPA: alpha/beta hydrolase [Ktedonobacteraceae bacterium]|nr:alpha/beta hydrolase [Ktedonobacteraceae bacterium]